MKNQILGSSRLVLWVSGIAISTSIALSVGMHAAHAIDSVTLMTEMGNRLPYVHYQGYTPDSRPCTLMVTKNVGLGGRPWAQIFMNGRDLVIFPNGAQYWRDAGFFQVGLPYVFQVTFWNITPFRLDAEVVAYTHGPVVAPSWRGRVLIHSFSNGVASHVAIHETHYNPHTGWGSTRSFACGNSAYPLAEAIGL